MEKHYSQKPLLIDQNHFFQFYNRKYLIVNQIILMKKILITGSHGFLARNTAFLLKKKSYKVYGIGNGKWNKKQYQKWGYDYLVNKEVNLKNLLKNFFTFVDTLVYALVISSNSLSLSRFPWGSNNSTVFL